MSMLITLKYPYDQRKKPKLLKLMAVYTDVSAVFHRFGTVSLFSNRMQLLITTTKKKGNAYDKCVSEEHSKRIREMGIASDTLEQNGGDREKLQISSRQITCTYLLGCITGKNLHYGCLTGTEKWRNDFCKREVRRFSNQNHDYS